ncbi:MAG: LysM peptidoglycan-binding domain-containing protein [Bacillota bacterium]
MPVNCPGGRIYEVKSGDTLSKIARRFNTTVQAIMAANPQIKDPNVIFAGQEICIPGMQEPPPVPRPRCVVLHPTDITPTSKAAVFIEPDLGSIVAILTNVPQPNILPDGEVYKLWVKRPTVTHYAVTTMEEVFPNYWIARLVPGFALPGADGLISAEKRANTTAPAGLGVAVGTL